MKVNRYEPATSILSSCRDKSLQYIACLLVSVVEMVAKSHPIALLKKIMFDHEVTTAMRAWLRRENLELGFSLRDKAAAAKAAAEARQHRSIPGVGCGYRYRQ